MNYEIFNKHNLNPMWFKTQYKFFLGLEQKYPKSIIVIKKWGLFTEIKSGIFNKYPFASFSF